MPSCGRAACNNKVKMWIDLFNKGIHYCWVGTGQSACIQNITSSLIFKIEVSGVNCFLRSVTHLLATDEGRMHHPFASADSYWCHKSTAVFCWTNLIATAIFPVVSTVIRLILICSMQLLYLYLDITIDKVTISIELIYH